MMRESGEILRMCARLQDAHADLKVLGLVLEVMLDIRDQLAALPVDVATAILDRPIRNAP